jgi:hypothetical protein
MLNNETVNYFSNHVFVCGGVRAGDNLLYRLRRWRQELYDNVLRALGGLWRQLTTLEN